MENNIIVVIVCVVTAVILILLSIIIVVLYKFNRYFDNREKLKELEEDYDILEKEIDDDERTIIFLETERDLFMQQCRDLEESEEKYINKADVEKPFKGKYALLGDYDVNSSERTRKVLRKLGFYVDVVRTGIQVIDRIKSGEYKYDIVFTNNIYKNGRDENGNSIGGQQVLNTIKDELKKRIPIVIVTISSDPKSDFLQSGFDACLKKPVNYDEFESTLTTLFNKKRNKKGENKNRN